MKISELKKEAKTKLAGKWPLAIEINLLHLVITLCISYIANSIQGIVGAIVALVLGIITIPISYGLTVSMLKLSRNEEIKIADFIVIGFKNFKRALFLSLSVFVRMLVPIILIAFAGALSIISAFANNISSADESAGIVSIISLVLSVGSMIWLIYKVLAYALSTYILIDDEEAKSKDAISKSCELMKGNKLKFVGLVLSFFGWFLLCGLLAGFAEIANPTFGMIVMYGLSLLLTPYITFTEINFYEDLAGISEVKIETPEEPMA